MAEVIVMHDCDDPSVVVWFGEPSEAVISEEMGDGLVAMRDRQGRVIGIELLSFPAYDGLPLSVRLMTPRIASNLRQPV